MTVIYLAGTFIIVQFYVPCQDPFIQNREVKTVFYNLLKEICTEKGTSPSAVAQAAGFSKSNVTNWRNGQAPKLDTIIKLAERLGVSPKELVPDESQDTTI